MQEIKQQLEDLSFATLHPKRYAEIDHMVALRAPEREIYLTQVLEHVRERLAELRIDGQVTGRPKHLWSIYEKMVVKGRSFDDIFDLVGIRVTVDSVKDCYAALGSIHATWKPVQGRFKDYIAMPKFNLYQSLHTTVVGPLGKPVEVQIRTSEMHQRAEFGVAAHWAYKDETAANDAAWLNRIVDWQQELNDPAEFMAGLKLALDSEEVYVFTPKGRVITLPKGATPIDFAYSVHTEVGHACVGARVNGRLVSLEQKLSSGDTCEVFTSKAEGTGPSRDWLSIVASPRAASKIRQWFSRERREDAIDNGRDELAKALRRQGLPVQKLAASMLSDVATGFNYADVEALYAAIGESHVSGQSVAARVGKLLRSGDPGQEEQLPATVRSPRRHRSATSNGGIHVEGLDDVMVRLSRCCTPVPGDEIIGFVTQGRGVSVHRADCANAVALSSGQPARMLDVEWDENGAGTFVASIEIKALDRTRLLRDVSAGLADHHVSILACTVNAGADRITKMRFEFELGDPSHLGALLRTVKGIEGVYDAYRVMPGRG